MANAKVDNADTDQDSDSRKYEEKHVHEVYEEIATHFSETRYKVRTSDCPFADAASR